jgi:hypothetical protein
LDASATHASESAASELHCHSNNLHIAATNGTLPKQRPAHCRSNKLAAFDDFVLLEAHQHHVDSTALRQPACVRWESV